MALFIQSTFGFGFFLSRLGKATSILEFEIIFVNTVKERKKKSINILAIKFKVVAAASQLPSGCSQQWVNAGPL